MAVMYNILIHLELMGHAGSWRAGLSLVLPIATIFYPITDPVERNARIGPMLPIGFAGKCVWRAGTAI